MKKLLSILLLLLISISCKHDKKTTVYVPPIKKQRTPLVSLIDSLNVDKENLTILIDKSDYKLSVISEDKTIRVYNLVFGTNPIDDKLMQGDRCTPEGKFKVRNFYPHNAWSKFIWIDYPTAESWKKHNKAKLENRINQDAKIGGEIGIHGVPDNNLSLISKKQNWTWGCISLSNEDINDLYEVVYKDMAIEIVK